MFNEIYNGFVEILKKGPEEEIEYMKKDKGKIPHLLSLLYNFDPLTVVRVKTIEMKDMHNIVLVLASTPDNNPDIKYSEYFVIDGKLSKIILINVDALMTEEDKDGYSRAATYAIATSVRSAIRAVMSNHLKGLNDDSGEVEFMGGFAKLLYYSSSIMITKILDRVYDNKVGEVEIAALLGVMFNAENHISTQTIKSIRDLLSGTSLYDLLDNSLLLAANPEVYPGLFYHDEDNKEEGDEDKTV